MTIIGGFIHNLGIIKLGGGGASVPTKLGFTPDRLTYFNHQDANLKQKTGNSHTRQQLPPAWSGSWGSDINTDLFVTKTYAVVGLTLKWIEIRNATASTVDDLTYFSKNSDTDLSGDLLLTITALTTGENTALGTVAIAEGEHFTLMRKRASGTTQGVEGAVGCIGWVYNE